MKPLTNQTLLDELYIKVITHYARRIIPDISEEEASLLVSSLGATLFVDFRVTLLNKIKSSVLDKHLLEKGNFNDIVSDNLLQLIINT